MKLSFPNMVLKLFSQFTGASVHGPNRLSMTKTLFFCWNGFPTDVHGLPNLSHSFHTRKHFGPDLEQIFARVGHSHTSFIEV